VTVYVYYLRIIYVLYIYNKIIISSSLYIYTYTYDICNIVYVIYICALSLSLFSMYYYVSTHIYEHECIGGIGRFNTVAEMSHQYQSISQSFISSSDEIKLYFT